MMFDSLIEENGLEIDKQDATFIKALIAGDPSMCKYVPVSYEITHTSYTCMLNC